VPFTINVKENEKADRTFCLGKVLNAENSNFLNYLIEIINYQFNAGVNKMSNF
jgi:hypothetical protein